MPERKKQSGIWAAAVVALIILATAGIWTVVKPKSKQQEPKPVAVIQHERSHESAVQLPQSSTTAHKSLKDIIASARTWGPVYQSLYGKVAPDFTLNDLQGNKHSLSDYRGKNVMLVFWATWCPPCKMEIPHLKALNSIIDKEKMPAALLAITSENPDKVRSFVAQQQMDYTILLDTGDMPAPFGVMRIYSNTGIPGSFFIDPQGRIKLATAGLLQLGDMKAILQATSSL